MPEQPETFNLTAYMESLKVLEDHKESFASGSWLQLAAVAGGPELLAAVNRYSFPPCPYHLLCERCWMASYCIHKEVPAKERGFLQQIESHIDNANIFDEQNLHSIYNLDKTDSIERLFLIQAMLVTLGEYGENSEPSTSTSSTHRKSKDKRADSDNAEGRRSSSLLDDRYSTSISRWENALLYPLMGSKRVH